MDASTTAQIFSWAAITLSVLTAFASAGALYYRNIATAQKDAQIERLKPRTISEEQKTALGKRLGGSTGTVAFIYRLMDGEGKDFAHQMADAFSAAGWQVASNAGNSLNDFPDTWWLRSAIKEWLTRLRK